MSIVPAVAAAITATFAAAGALIGVGMLIQRVRNLEKGFDDYRAMMGGQFESLHKEIAHLRGLIEAMLGAPVRRIGSTQLPD